MAVVLTRCVDTKTVFVDFGAAVGISWTDFVLVSYTCSRRATTAALTFYIKSSASPTASQVATAYNRLVALINAGTFSYASSATLANGTTSRSSVAAASAAAMGIILCGNLCIMSLATLLLVM